MGDKTWKDLSQKERDDISKYFKGIERSRILEIIDKVCDKTFNVHMIGDATSKEGGNMYVLWAEVQEKVEEIKKAIEELE